MISSKGYYCLYIFFFSNILQQFVKCCYPDLFFTEKKNSGQIRNYFKIGLLEKCVIYSFCIDNEHDEGKIKVETFFLFLFNQSNFKILIANSKVDLLVKKQLIFPSLLESHPDLKCNSRGIVCIFFAGANKFWKIYI